MDDMGKWLSMFQHMNCGKSFTKMSFINVQVIYQDVFHYCSGHLPRCLSLLFKSFTKMSFIYAQVIYQDVFH